MIAANLFLASLMLSVLILNDNSNTKTVADIDLYGGKALPVADVTMVTLNEAGNQANIEFAHHPPRLIIKTAEPLFDYKTSDNRHKSIKHVVKNKYATLPGNNHAKRKKRKRNSGLKIPFNSYTKKPNLDLLSNDYTKMKRKVIV
jgi:hypothetical protein